MGHSVRRPECDEGASGATRKEQGCTELTRHHKTDARDPRHRTASGSRACQNMRILASPSERVCRSRILG